MPASFWREFNLKNGKTERRAVFVTDGVELILTERDLQWLGDLEYAFEEHPDILPDGTLIARAHRV